MLSTHYRIPVRQLQTMVNAHDFAELLAYHSIEPFTVDRSEYQLAVIATILANVHRKKGQSPYKPADFIPKRESKRDTAESIEIKLRALFSGNH